MRVPSLPSCFWNCPSYARSTTCTRSSSWPSRSSHERQIVSSFNYAVLSPLELPDSVLLSSQIFPPHKLEAWSRGGREQQAELLCTVKVEGVTFLVKQNCKGNNTEGLLFLGETVCTYAVLFQRHLLECYFRLKLFNCLCNMWSMFTLLVFLWFLRCCCLPTAMLCMMVDLGTIGECFFHLSSWCLNKPRYLEYGNGRIFPYSLCFAKHN